MAFQALVMVWLPAKVNARLHPVRATELVIVRFAVNPPVQLLAV